MRSVIVLLLAEVPESVEEKLVEWGRDTYDSGRGWNVARYIS